MARLSTRQWSTGFLLIAAVLAFQGHEAHGQRPTITKQGISLEIFSSSSDRQVVRGRVSLTTVNSFSQATVTRPMCDDSLDDNMAVQLCKWLGYNVGRKYWSTSTTFRPRTTCENRMSLKPWSFIQCGPLTHRRMSRAMLDSAATSAQRRSLLPAWSDLAAGPYLIDGERSVCRTFPGGCEFSGALAGLECAMTQALLDSKPPTQPLPSPPVPDVSTSITDIMPVEPNLCNGAANCDKVFRVEMKVLVDNAIVSVPLCAPTPGQLPALRDVVCRQLNNWKVTDFGGFDYDRTPSWPYSLALPTATGTLPAGSFDPRKYQFFYKVKEGVKLPGITPCTRAVQELPYTLVQASSCTNGLLVLNCRQRMA